MANSRSCRSALRRSGLERPAPRMVRLRLPVCLAACAAFAASTRSRTPFSSSTATVASPSTSTRNASLRPSSSTATVPSKPLHTVTAAPRRRPLPSPTSWHSRRSNWNVRFFDSFRVACSHRIRSSSSASCRTGRCASSASRRRPEAAVEVRRELRQVRVRRLHPVDPPQPHHLHEPILQRPVRPLHAPLRLRRAGVDRLDVQRPQRPRELRRRVNAESPASNGSKVRPQRRQRYMLGLSGRPRCRRPRGG